MKPRDAHALAAALLGADRPRKLRKWIVAEKIALLLREPGVRFPPPSSLAGKTDAAKRKRLRVPKGAA
eukprot:3556225-Prymnesium_polylepis.1